MSRFEFDLTADEFCKLVPPWDDCIEEAAKAIRQWPSFNSAHEGYAVLLEEVDELWDHVKVRQDKRDLAAMRKEAVQVAAMALLFIVDVCDSGRGHK